jgi:predicted ferric reductase
MFSRLGIVLIVLFTAASVAFSLAAIGRNLVFPLELQPAIYAVGKTLAILAFFALTLQYILTARLKFLERLISFDRRVSIHRALGFLAILLLSLHPITVLGSYALRGLSLPMSVPILLGFLTFLILLLIAGSTFLGRVWGVRYESWKRLHWFNFSVLTLAFIHSMLIGGDITGPVRIAWIGLFALHGAVLAGKFYHKIRVWFRTFTVAEVRRENAQVCTLRIDAPPTTYSPGQFGFLSLKLQDRWQSWHPFSLTSLGPDELATLTIKSLGDFTNHVCSVRSGDAAKLDLGFGGFSPRFVPDRRYVMIAGGIGITPIYAILKDLSGREEPPQVLLLYSCHNESEILFRDELEHLFSEREHWRLTYVLTSQPDWSGVSGRLTPDRLPELCDRDFSGTFMLCGPLPMIRDLRRYLIGRGVPRRKIRRELFVLLP